MFPRSIWPLSARKLMEFEGPVPRTKSSDLGVGVRSRKVLEMTDFEMSCKPIPKHSPFHQLWRTVKKRNFFSMFRVIAFPETNFFSMLESYHRQKSCFRSLCRANKHTQNLKTPVGNFFQNFNIHTIRCDFLYIHDEQVHRLAASQ